MRRPPLFTIALLVALAVVTMWWQLAERRGRLAEAALRSESVRRAAAEDSLRRTPPSASPDLETPGPRRLHALREDLARHPELIGHPGVLGGTMAFHDTASIVAVGPHWVYAEFDDGHVAGRGIFEHHEEPGGRIRWRRVVSELD